MRTKNKIKIVLCAWAVPFLILNSLVCAADEQGFLREEIPLVFAPDLKEPLFTSMVLEVSSKSYEKPVAEFLKEDHSTVEKTFTDVLSSIQDGNVSKLITLSKLDEEWTAESVKFYCEQTVSLGFPDLVVKRNLMLGNHYIFITELQKKILNNKYKREVKHQFPFRFEANQSGRVKWYGWYDNDRQKLYTLMEQSLQAQSDFPENHKKFLTSKKSEYKYKIPILGAHGDNVAFLKFNGTPYNRDIFSDSNTPEDKVFTAYQTIYRDFRDGTLEDYAKHFTPKSRDKVLLMKKHGEKVYDDHRKFELKNDRIVRFILDADPLYVVFWEIPEVQKFENYTLKTENSFIKYDMLIKDASSGKYLLTNYYAGSFMQYFIKTDSLFKSKVYDKLIKN